ncbi:hypothetical protein [Comamonas sp. 26]|uniref:hypothetical protein n=1 Tax=Comamonas sp. 26 TaxID=2035201 RepID=UPI000C174053|nr:hypothetical protein [Comamonas sp. 26]PIG09936.1 hypothetical protein CLU84_2901 [Comamonas sp. 26]
MTFDTFLTMAFTSLVSSGLAVFLLKKWVEHLFSARLAKLETENRMRAHEHQIRFTRFDEKLAHAIEEAYESVCAYTEAVQHSVRVMHEQGIDAAKDSVKNTDELAFEFMNAMRRNAIYLPEGITNKLRETRYALRDAYSAELFYFRDKQAGETEAVSSVIKGVYRNAGLRDSCDKLMLELQCMLREHLSRFERVH